MLPLGVGLLFAAAILAGFFGMRAVVNGCLSAQRRKLREDFEVVAGRRVTREEAAALLLPLRA